MSNNNQNNNEDDTNLKNENINPIPSIEDADEKFDLQYHHSRLEVLESRINYGFDEDHNHPGIAALIEWAVGKLDCTHEEEKLKEHYIQLPPTKKVPTFWEPRPWDKPENILTEKENQILIEKIQQQTNIDPDDPEFIDNFDPNTLLDGEEEEKSEHNDENDEKNKKSKFKLNLVFSASHIFYGTDDSQDETDLESFY